MSSAVFIFGNPDIESDSLPARILPKLRENFPSLNFEMKDPNEEWEIPDDLVVIDVAEGIDEVTVFNDLKNFASPPRVGMHDFDALTNLRYMEKIGKLKKIKIIALPMGMSEDDAVKEVSEFLNSAK